MRDGLKTRGALPVDSVDGDGVGEARHKRGNAALVGSLRTGPEHCTDDDVANELGVDLGLINGGLENRAQQILDEGILETTTSGLANRRSEGRDNHNVIVRLDARRSKREIARGSGGRANRGGCGGRAINVADERSYAVHCEGFLKVGQGQWQGYE